MNSPMSSGVNSENVFSPMFNSFALGMPRRTHAANGFEPSLSKLARQRQSAQSAPNL
jgi:hypothetical protein